MTFDGRMVGNTGQNSNDKDQSTRTFRDKKPIPQGRVQYDPIRMTCVKWHNYIHTEQSSGCPASGEAGRLWGL